MFCKINQKSYHSNSTITLFSQSNSILVQVMLRREEIVQNVILDELIPGLEKPISSWILLQKSSFSEDSPKETVLLSHEISAPDKTMVHAESLGIRANSTVYTCSVFGLFIYLPCDTDEKPPDEEGFFSLSLL